MKQQPTHQSGTARCDLTSTASEESLFFRNRKISTERETTSQVESMKRYNDTFLSQLEGFDLTTLENDPHCIYGLARDLTLNYLNPAWFKFATENDEGTNISKHYPIGTPIMKAMNEPFRTYYTGIYRTLLETGDFWHHEYECSSNNTYRLYYQTIYPLRSLSGLLIVNSLVVEQPHQTISLSETSSLLDKYQEATGLITACCHCRRIQRVIEPGTWDRILHREEQMPPNISHSLCLICYDYFYKYLKKIA